MNTVIKNRGTSRIPKTVLSSIPIYDRNYNLLDFTYSQLTATGALSASYTAKEGGYAYLYVSNEHPTQVDVYFDDITMSYIPSRIIQSNEYYPFGAQTARSWTRESAAPNNFLGNGGTEYNTISSQYDLDFRNYDPILGRLNQVDPMSNKYGGLSPYHFSANNPVSLNDPSGADYDISAGPYTAGTPWSHNWVTGRPANQEGRADRLTREYWQQWNDLNDTKAGHMSEEKYAAKYGENLIVWNPWLGEKNDNGRYQGGWAIASDQLVDKIRGYGYSLKYKSLMDQATSVTKQSGPDISQPINAIGGMFEAFEVGSIVGTFQKINEMTYSAIKSGLRLSKVIGRSASALSYAGIVYNVANTGKLTGSDMVNFGATSVLIAAAVLSAPVVAPALAVTGLIVSIATFAGEDYLNDKISTIKIFDK